MVVISKIAGVYCYTGSIFCYLGGIQWWLERIKRVYKEIRAIKSLRDFESHKYVGIWDKYFVI